jgi:hypothetical protein
MHQFDHRWLNTSNCERSCYIPQEFTNKIVSIDKERCLGNAAPDSEFAIYH